MGKRRPVMWQLPMRSPLYFKLGSNLPLLIRRKEGFEVVPVGIPHCIFLFGSRACEDHHEIKAKGQQRETTGSHCKATCLIFPWKRFKKKIQLLYLPRLWNQCSDRLRSDVSQNTKHMNNCPKSCRICFPSLIHVCIAPHSRQNFRHVVIFQIMGWLLFVEAWKVSPP